MQRKWKRNWRRTVGKAVAVPVATGLIMLATYGPAWAAGATLPTGAAVTSGTAAIATDGAKMTVTTSDKVGINWQSFSIGAGSAVQFIQPSSSSVALNRVVGTNASNIYGTLTANGKVFLINPNGILFAPGSQVNVGGLVASTLGISDSNFNNGKYVFEKNGNAGSVVNQGAITAADHAVLIGPQVKNEGVIAARVTALAAGNKVSLDFAGDKLLNVAVDTAAAGSSVTNSGAITAPGGLVLMTTGTKDALLDTVVNNSGVIRAQTVSNVGGVIRLEGSTVNVSGTLDASAPQGGNGGFIETSGAKVNIAPGTVITAAAPAGTGGKWLLDPTDITIDATLAGTIATTLNGGTDVTLTTDTGGTDAGDITVAAPLSWSTSTLTLKADRDITIAAPITDANGFLTLAAKRDIIFNQSVTGSPAASGSGVAATFGWRDLMLTGTAGRDIRINAPLQVKYLDLTTARSGGGHIYINTPELTAGYQMWLRGNILLQQDVKLTAIGGGAYSSMITIGGPLDPTDEERLMLNGILDGGGHDLTVTNGYNAALAIKGGNSETWFDSSVVNVRNLTLATASTRFYNPVTLTGSLTASGIYIDALNHVLAGGFVSVFSSAGNPITTVGDQTYGGQLSMYSTGTLTSTAGNININGGLYASGKGVTLDAAGRTTLYGTSTLGSLTVNRAATLGGTITTTGSQTYSGQVTVAAGGLAVETTGSAGDVTFADNVGGTGLFFVNTTGAGDVTFKGTVDGRISTNIKGSVAFEKAVTLSGTLTTTGSQTYSGAVTAGGLTVNTTGAGDVTFADTIDGSGLFRVNAKGSVTFAKALGAVTPLSGVDLAATGTISLSGDSVTTTGGQVYRSRVVLAGGGPKTFAATDSAISFYSTLTGSGQDLIVRSGTGTSSFGAVSSIGALTVQGSGATTFGAAVTAGSLSVAGGANIYGASITTSGSQTYTGPVTLWANTALTTTGTGSILFNSTVDGAHGLAVNSAGGVTFDGAVGNTARLASLTVDSVGDTNLNTNTLLTTGDQVYNGRLVLAGSSPTTFAATTGAISFTRALAVLGQDLILQSGTGTTFGAAVTARSLTVAGGATLSGGSVTTSGSQSYGGPVTLGADTTLTTTGTGSISFTGAVDGAFGLAVNSASGVAFGGSVGNTARLASLTVDAVGDTTFSTNSVLTTGVQTYRGPVVLAGSGPTTFAATDSAISFSRALTGSGQDLTVHSGTGTASFAAVSGLGALRVEGVSININGGSITTSGTQNYLGNVTLGTDTVLTSTGGTGDIQFSGVSAGAHTLLARAGRDIYVAAPIQSTAAGDAVVLVAGRYFRNPTAMANFQTPNGRWLVYSSAPTSAADGLAYSFKQYNAAYGDAVLGTGNGLLYTLAPTVTVSLTGTAAKTYDGTAAATLAAGNYTFTGAQSFDRLTVSGTATYADKNAGNGKAVTVTGLTVTVTDRDNNAPVYGYVIANAGGTASGNIGTIAKAVLTAGGITATDKVYDGTRDATLSTGGAVLAGAVAGDDVSLSVAGATGAFADKNAGSGKAVTVGGLTLSGADKDNYTVTATTTASITKRDLTVTAAGQNKTYDGTTAATVTYGDNRVAGDTLTVSGSAAFADKNAATGKTVTVSGITLGGADAANYTYNTTAATAADIGKLALTVTASAQNKTYDGTTAATVTYGDNRVAGDTLTVSGTAAFADKNAGAGKSVSASGITITGADAANYTYNATAATTADIGKALLTVTADSFSRSVGQANPTLTYSYGGLKGSDTAASLSGQLTLSTGATTASPAGSYAITLSGNLASPNYTFRYVDGVLTVRTPTDPVYTAVIGSAVGTLGGAGSLIGLPGGTGGLISGFGGLSAGGAGIVVGGNTGGLGGLLTITGGGINLGGLVQGSLNQ